MKILLNVRKLYKLDDELLLEVFEAGFAVLGARSPLVTNPQKMGLRFTTDVIWFIPADEGDKRKALCYLTTDSENPNYLQFGSDHRKFDQIAAIQKLHDLDVIEFKPSDASDD